MKRLIAFGCSHTWGDSLSVDQNGVECKNLPPHKKSWPYILGNLLGRETINISYPGESNKAISHKIFNFKFEPDDIVIPLWTQVGRYCKIGDIKASYVENYTRFNTWYIIRDDKISKAYFRDYHTFGDEYYQIFSYIQSINFTMIPKVASFINCYSSDEVLNFMKTNSKLINYFSISFFEGYYKYGRGVDGTHLGSKAHQKFAEDLYRVLGQECPKLI
jgi:hypothetical protein